MNNNVVYVGGGNFTIGSQVQFAYLSMTDVGTYCRTDVKGTLLDSFCDISGKKYIVVASGTCNNLSSNVFCTDQIVYDSLVNLED